MKRLFRTKSLHIIGSQNKTNSLKEYLKDYFGVKDNKPFLILVEGQVELRDLVIEDDIKVFRSENEVLKSYIAVYQSSRKPFILTFMEGYLPRPEIIFDLMKRTSRGTSYPMKRRVYEATRYTRVDNLVKSRKGRA